MEVNSFQIINSLIITHESLLIMRMDTIKREQMAESWQFVQIQHIIIAHKTEKNISPTVYLSHSLPNHTYWMKFDSKQSWYQDGCCLKSISSISLVSTTNFHLLFGLRMQLRLVGIPGVAFFGKEDDVTFLGWDFFLAVLFRVPLQQNTTQH